eukprot:TRINITY_DN12276_c0_g1_i1.p1 TRINITY_DN12276_c0_g1~~TRINITY_DN12276_c0_g1_i1.p1  ORF type:complete len:267 (+),score=31.37 TRINITY_DN12276_c0_g1_i1:20-820(+)
MNNPRFYHLVNKKPNNYNLSLKPSKDNGELWTIKVMNYVCTGKLTLFPTIIIFLGFGAGILLLHGDKSYTSGYFESTEVYYGIAGVILLILVVILLASMIIWMVLRVTFIITPTQFKIIKTGILRTSVLEFDVKNVSVHYFRTHFIEERSWLQLVIREYDQYYQIFSWKGKGKQKERFKKLFNSLKREIKKVQGKSTVQGVNYEIVSNKERNLIGPFSDRLKQLFGSSDNQQERPICIEEIPVISYDSFFNHLKTNKKIEDADAFD